MARHFIRHGNAWMLTLALLLVLGAALFFLPNAARPQSHAPLKRSEQGGLVVRDGAALIDINRADEALLQTLPGIGPQLAQAIMTYRAERGAFERLDELLNVPGIGKAKLSAIRGRITFTPE